MRERTTSLLLIAAAAAMLMSLSAVYADTIVVTPANMASLGWATATAYGASCSFRDASIQMPLPFTDPAEYVSPAGGPLPYGAFYGNCGWEGSTDQSRNPGQVWLGTNQYSGTYIRDIDNISFTTWTLRSGPESGHYSKQPFQIYITIRKNGPGTPDWRTLVFRPWGTTTHPEGWDGGNPYNVWESSSGMWYELWSDARFADWAEVKSAYPNGYIDTPVQSFDMFPLKDEQGRAKSDPGTGTGYSINIVAGARQQIMNVFGISSYAWWRESIRFEGFVDNFSIGVRSVPGDPFSEIIQTTYDFEPADRPAIKRTIFIKNRDAKRRPVRQMKYSNKFVAVGYVQLDEYNPLDSFILGETSPAVPDAVPGSLIKVISKGNTVLPGDFVRVEGMIDDITAIPLLMAKPEDIMPIY